MADYRGLGFEWLRNIFNPRRIGEEVTPTPNAPGAPANPFGSRYGGEPEPEPPITPSRLGYAAGSEGALRNERINNLMKTMQEQMSESEKVLAHYEKFPDVPYEMRQLETEPGPSLNEPPIPEPTPQPVGGTEDIGRPGAFNFGGADALQHREAGAPRFAPPVRPRRRVTRGGGAVRAGGNTALRLLPSDFSGFNLVRGAAGSGGGASGTAGGGTLDGVFAPGEIDRFRRRFGLR